MRRERLLRLLDEFSEDALTMVVAPPGAGKTVLLADWSASTAREHAWVTLDESDADPNQLGIVITAALAQLRPAAVQTAAPLFRGGAALADAMQALLNDLHACDGPDLTLLVDDLHVLDGSPEAQASFMELAQNLPWWLHLLLATRRRPPLPIDRMLANGTMAEIRFPELRLTPSEAVEMMTRLAPSMPSERIRAAVTRADGWPAALQLAALAARTRQAIPVVHGEGPEGERLVNEYVWREVLRNESPDVVAVLLETAVAERLAPGLAEALTGRPDAFSLLLEAEERGLFVTRLEHGGWLQVHAPVREVLLAEARHRSPEQLVEQHRRAARWFEEIGEFPAALDHWIAGEEPREALRLLASSQAELYDTGRQATVMHMLRRVSRADAGTDAAALMNYAFPQLLVSRRGFLETVATLRQVLDSSDSLGQLTVHRAQAFFAQAELMAGDWDDAEGRMRTVLAAVGPAAPLDQFLRFGWNIVGRGIALTERWDERSPEVQETRHGLSSDHERLVAWEATRAMGLALAGRPTDAVRVSAGVRRTADIANMNLQRAELDVAEALSHFELGDFDTAEELFTRIRAAHVPAVPYARVLCVLAEIDHALLLGDTDAAARAFEDVRALVQELLPGRRGQGWIARRGARVALARDEVEAAQWWADANPDPFWRHLGRARVLLRRGEGSSALGELDAAQPRCSKHRVVRELLRARAVDDREIAVKGVADAIEVAAEAGMVVTVALEGEEVTQLAELAAYRVPQPWMDRLRRASVPPLQAGLATGQIERLTEREHEVLRLLPSRLSLKEIADELFVSPNTLKFHLRVIYRKLAVNSRGEAVEKTQHLDRPGADTRR